MRLFKGKMDRLRSGPFTRIAKEHRRVVGVVDDSHQLAVVNWSLGELRQKKGGRADNAIRQISR